MLYRPVRWNYFYDNDGQPIIRLVRKLTKIRLGGTQFSDGEHYFYNDDTNFNSKGLLAFSRQLGRHIQPGCRQFYESAADYELRLPHER